MRIDAREVYARAEAGEFLVDIAASYGIDHAKALRLYARGAEAAADGDEVPDPFTSRRRPCACCGARFSTTRTRRMLCENCYRRGSPVAD